MWNRDIIGSFVNFCSVFASENGPATGVQPSLDLNKRWSVPCLEMHWRLAQYAAIPPPDIVVRLDLILVMACHPFWI